jgi:hypothetical protein
MLIINRTIHAVRFCNYMLSLEYISYMLAGSINICTYASRRVLTLPGFDSKSATNPTIVNCKLFWFLVEQPVFTRYLSK